MFENAGRLRLLFRRARGVAHLPSQTDTLLQQVTNLAPGDGAAMIGLVVDADDLLCLLIRDDELPGGLRDAFLITSGPNLNTYNRTGSAAVR